MFCIIISEFCYKEEPRQVIFFIINKSSKVSSYCAILPLSLAVDLRVEDGREPPFDAQKVAQGRPKLNCEYWATVAVNKVGQTIVLNYKIKNYFC